jgi:hypothetical protein
LIDFEIPDELKSVVSELGYNNKVTIKITFTQVYDKVSLNSIFTTRNIQKSFDEFEKRIRKFVPNITDHHYNLIENTIYDNLLSNNGDTSSEDMDKDGNRGNSQRRLTVNKYCQNRKGNLFESILLDGEPLFLNLDKEGEITLKPHLEEKNRLLYPPSEDEILHQPYQFESKQEIESIITLAKKETIFTLFRKARSIVSKYVDQEDHLINLISVNTIFSYFQDRFSTVHYIGIFGDNGTGKSSIGDVAEAMFYRAVNTTDPNAANIFRSLGNIEPGQITLILDEAEKVDQYTDMITLLKSGYAFNKKVSRINPNTGKPEQFFAFCIKMIIGERPPNADIAKGVNERILGDVVYFGNPQYDIKEVLNPTDTGGEELKAALTEITEFRKLLFIYRILHFNDHIGNIDPGLVGRNKELVKPYLQLFSPFRTEEDKQTYQELDNTFRTLVRIKNSKKNSSLEYTLIPLILDLMEESKKNTRVRFSDLWDRIQYHIKGKLNENKPNEYHTEDYGTIYRQTLSNTLEKIGVKTKRHNTYVELLFDRRKITKTASQYGHFVQEKIENDNDNDGEDSEPSEDVIAHSTEKTPSDIDSLTKIFTENNISITKNSSTITKNDEKENIPTSADNKKDSDSSHGLHCVHSVHSNEISKDVLRPNIFRIGRSDIFECHGCKMKGDKWFMQKHPCRGSSNHHYQTKG